MTREARLMFVDFCSKSLDFVRSAAKRGDLTFYFRVHSFSVSVRCRRIPPPAADMASKNDVFIEKSKILLFTPRNLISTIFGARSGPPERPGGLGTYIS